MLDQVIYTECNPQRDLLHDGKIIHKSGYGIFSMSREIFSEENRKRLRNLFDIFTYTNCSKEKDPSVGTFGSYIYTDTVSGLRVFLFDYGRPHCKNPLKERLHRSGIHIKQCLIGQTLDYPCRWFGASVWNAWREHEDQYYFDDVAGYEPPFLPQVPAECPDDGGVNVSGVEQFVRDGRQKVLAAAVGFVLQQLRVPADQQKVLLIRDDPQKVELWIAAIEMAMPKSLAARITFNTNVTNLSNKTETRLFYFTDANAQRMAATDSENQKKQPYFLIAGYHPHDDSSSAVRQFAASRFVILDGERLVLDYVPEDAQRHYYKAVEEYGSRLRDFCDTVLPVLPEQLAEVDLAALFDAYWYLTETSHSWDYQEALLQIRQITQAGLPAGELSQRILAVCLKMYERFSEADRLNNYALLERMTWLARQCGKENDVTVCIADGIQKTLNKSNTGGVLFATNWASIRNSVLSELVQPILCELLNDTELEEYYQRFPYSDPLSIETMLDMFFTMLSNEGNVTEHFLGNRVRMLFVFRGILALTESEENLLRIVRKIKRYDKVMEFLNFNVGAALLNQKPENANRWFNIVIDECGLSLFDICEGLCGIQGVTIDRVEDYLKSRVKKTGTLDAAVVTAFNHAIKQLGCHEKTGIRLFEEGIRLADAQDFNRLVQYVQKCSLSMQAGARIFEEMDRRLIFRCDSDEVSEKTFESMKSWGSRLKKPCISMPLHEFCVTLERSADPQKVLAAIQRFSRNRITLPVGFIPSAPLEHMTDKVGECRDGAVYLAFMTMFETTEQEKLVTTFVCRLMDKAAAANLTERQLIPLCSAAVLPYRSAGASEERTAHTRKLILEVLDFRMADYYRPNLESKITKSKECDRHVRDVLLRLIKSSKNNRKKSGFGGLINNMFNRDK